MRSALKYLSFSIITVFLLSDTVMRVERKHCVDRSRTLSKVLRFSSSAECLSFYESLNQIEHELSEKDGKAVTFSFSEERELLKAYREEPSK